MFQTLVQVGGSLLILIPFALAQLGRWRTDATAYVVLNLVGSSILAADALHGRQWGFLLLEGVWALVSAWSLVRRKPAVDTGAEMVGAEGIEPPTTSL